MGFSRPLSLFYHHAARERGLPLGLNREQVQARREAGSKQTGALPLETK